MLGEAVLDPASKRYNLNNLVNGLTGLRRWQDLLLDATDEERATALALITVASRIDEPFIRNYARNGEQATSIVSTSLTEFIATHPDQAADIARIINERETDSVALISDVLEHDQQALSEGVL